MAREEEGEPAGWLAQAVGGAVGVDKAGLRVIVDEIGEATQLLGEIVLIAGDNGESGLGCGIEGLRRFPSDALEHAR